MSDSESMPEAEAETASVPVPMSFQAFAATLRPQPIRDRRTGRQVGLTAGHPDEIWLKLLARLHGREKHTAGEWQALIKRHAAEPAYA